MWNKFGKAKRVTHISLEGGGKKFRLVDREHTNGFSRTLFVWKFSDRRIKFCWVPLWEDGSTCPLPSYE